MECKYRQTSVVTLAHHVEEEGVSVVVERLVVEEELGEEAEVLRVRLVLAAVDLEEGYLWRVQLIKQVFIGIQHDLYTQYGLYRTAVGTKLTFCSIKICQFLSMSAKH